MLSSVLLAISSSVDSLGIGVTYGIKNTKISLIGKLILILISLSISYLAILLGSFLKNFFPNFLTRLIGNGILILMGIYIFNNPISYDLDNSNIIDSKESLLLSIALSLDSFGIGIGGSITNINLTLFPILVSIFQLFFLNIGANLGISIKKLYKLPQNTCSIISAIFLIFIGLLKLLLNI